MPEALLAGACDIDPQWYPGQVRQYANTLRSTQLFPQQLLPECPAATKTTVCSTSTSMYPGSLSVAP
jgi:hypothetical protein